MELERPCPIPLELLHAAALWYRGGYTCKAPGGYVREYNPFHPFASCRGLVMQHRLVMERHIGRLLHRGEIVHHLNGVRADNRIENLELHEHQSAHMVEHHKPRSVVRDTELVERVRMAAADPSVSLKDTGLSAKAIYKICRYHGIEWMAQSKGDNLTEAAAKHALQGRTTREAAEELGVHPQTLYNRFPHLLQKRRAPGYLDSHKEEIRRIATEKGVAEAARVFQTARGVIHKNLRRWSKEDAM